MSTKLVRITEDDYDNATHATIRKGYRRYLDEIGSKRGALSLLRLYRDPSTRVFFFKCKCKCGNTALINANAIVQAGQIFCSNDCKLKTKHINSVRKYNGREWHKLTYKKLKKQGKLPENLTFKEANRLLNIWRMMLKRCGHIGSTPEKNYHGRGITVHKSWRKDPWPFILYIGPRPSPQHSVDRIDNEGNYEPGNVKWSTLREQAANSRKVQNADINNFAKLFAFRAVDKSKVDAIFTHENKPILWRIRCGECKKKRYLKRMNASHPERFVRACSCINASGMSPHTSLKEALVYDLKLDPKVVKRHLP